MMGLCHVYLKIQWSLFLARSNSSKDPEHIMPLAKLY